MSKRLKKNEDKTFQSSYSFSTVNKTKAATHTTTLTNNTLSIIPPSPLKIVEKKSTGVETLNLKSVVTLNNGFQMPFMGLGLSHNGGYSNYAVLHALNKGVRLFDTAARYGNETEVGKCIVKSKVKREDLFLTTKLWPDNSFNVREACQDSCKKLGVEYLDLYLIHWPGPWNLRTKFSNRELRANTWRQMERLLEDGLCRSIGVSNFLEHHTKDLLDDTNIIPAVNQIEINPLQFPVKLIDYCKSKQIIVEGYCPLGKGRILTNKTIQSIARKYKKTAAQVAIRWSLQHNIITIPKSTKSYRIDENCEVFDFTLEPRDMDALNDLHENLRVTWNPSNVA